MNLNHTRMRKHMLVGGLLLLLLSFIALSGLYSHNYSARSLANNASNAGTNQSAPQDPPRFVSPFEKIDMSARMAQKNEVERKVSGDEGSVKELFDSIFEMASIGHSQLPPEIVTLLKDRLGKSEMKYRDGKHKKIREADLARAVNNMSKKLELPEHSKTFIAQIRRLRVTILPHIPTLIGKVDKNPNHAAGRQMGAMMTTEMSPAEAILIAMILIDQKVHTDLYQTTPKEWGKKVREQADIAKNQQSNDKPSFKLSNNPKSAEIHEHLLTKAKSLEVRDITELATRFLDDLGIE